MMITYEIGIHGYVIQSVASLQDVFDSLRIPYVIIYLLIKTYEYMIKEGFNAARTGNLAETMSYKVIVTHIAIISS